ncbi:hypothetical protein AMS68_002300 [Peltaster fructicola]|uniref:Small ribosomal subunit protein mS29 n=1 Tax=Peltaster fructicola TaxID=286661 RepID=A0A6H0XPZ8_9PEZI|nr:hypothetical protein AMS68_002300 [Peltaster fructicola]
MPGAMCLRCLTRSISSLERPITQLQPLAKAAFSTTANFQKGVKKSASLVKNGSQTGGGTRLRLKKTKRVVTGRPPQPGERKAIRKRIVLSNTNALEIRGLHRFQKDNISASSLEKMRGSFLAFDEATIDALRALQAFKTSQSWSMFRTAATLVRHDTITLARVIEQQTTDSAGDNPSAASLVLFGERGSGKSVLQLQAMSQELTIGTTSYQPTVDSVGKTVYAQPHLTAKLLENILTANESILSGMRLSKKHQLPISIPDNISIARLLQLASRDPSIAWPVWQVLMQELSSTPQKGEGLHRPPVLLTLDSMAHFMKSSEYLNEDVNSIHAQELALVASFTSFLNGQQPMRNGGLVLAATSGSNRPATPTLDFILAERHAAMKKQAKPTWDPYMERDALVDRALQGVQAHKIEGLTKDEAKGAMEYYALSGILRDRITDSFVAEKWTISGGGVMGELERSCIRQKF